MRSFISELIRIIRHYRLDEKKTSQIKTGIDWKQILTLAEYGKLSKNMARNYLCLIETDVNYLNDFPDFLHKLPDADQLYADGRPHVRLGALADASDLEFGIRFDGPLFILCAGLTGFGKTTDEIIAYITTSQNSAAGLNQDLNQYKQKSDLQEARIAEMEQQLGNQVKEKSKLAKGEPPLVVV